LDFLFLLKCNNRTPIVFLLTYCVLLIKLHLLGIRQLPSSCTWFDVFNNLFLKLIWKGKFNWINCNSLASLVELKLKWQEKNSRSRWSRIWSMVVVLLRSQFKGNQLLQFTEMGFQGWRQIKRILSFLKTKIHINI